MMEEMSLMWELSFDLELGIQLPTRLEGMPGDGKLLKGSVQHETNYNPFLQEIHTVFNLIPQ